MFTLLWLACSAECPPNSSRNSDGLCQLHDTDEDPAPSGDSGDVDTGDVTEGDCPAKTSTDAYEQYPVYIDGTLRRFVTIQDGIWGAEDGDTVVVCPGTYSEVIDLKGKLITLRSAAGARQTIIDAQGGGSVVTLRNYEPAQTVLEGFTLTGGDAWVGDKADGHGGGIFVEWGSPTIRHNIITNNTAMIAGGVYIRNGGANVHNNIIANNRATEGGGGIVCTACSGEVMFNTLFKNEAHIGPAAEWYWGIADMVGNIIVSDETFGDKAAVRFMEPRGDDFTVSQNLLWPHDEFVNTQGPDADAWPAVDNLFTNPMLADPDGGDFRPAAGSPAIDAGPAGVTDPDGSAADIGAFGGPHGDWEG